VQTAFSAKLEVMPSAQPTDCTAEVVRILTFPQNGKRLRANGCVIAVAEFDGRNGIETVVEIGRKSCTGKERIKIRKLSADTMGKSKPRK
jgi:hypothetical protein